jgi:predicted Rossmann fold flavoprotein
MPLVRIAIVGGGAAGFFGALAAAARQPGASITILEASRQPLQKVRISGGGRCNVTHHCFEPRELVKGYPRGSRELVGPFTRFGPRETVDWFQARGVPLKAEADGRMFPVTDQSATVVDCLLAAARQARIELRVGANVKTVSPQLEIESAGGVRETFDRVLLATGGSPSGYRCAAALGHAIVPCVPSLFTFTIDDPRLTGLAGVSFDDVEVGIADGRSKILTQRGPLLITHWGLSGPAVLRLSAWGARKLAEDRYHATLAINFLPGRKVHDIQRELAAFRTAHASKRLQSVNPFGMPSRYWTRLVEHAGLAGDRPWGRASTKAVGTLVGALTDARFQITGKGVFKEEFVTSGGVSLKEVDFRTMQSKLVPGLFFAGEVLDIDGITGGFNFQSAWTTGWIAGENT